MLLAFPPNNHTMVPSTAARVRMLLFEYAKRHLVTAELACRHKTALVPKLGQRTAKFQAELLGILPKLGGLYSFDA